MTLGNYNANQIWPQLAKIQPQIHIAVVALLALYLVAYAAELTWRLLPQPDSAISSEFNGSPTSGVSLNKAGQPVNIAKVKRLNLFGDLTAAPVVEQPQVTEAPETNLNLSLTGVVASTEPSVAAAIIENRGEQNTYGIEEKIDGTNAVLKEVYADRVIIRNGTRRETLMLDGLDYSKNAVQNKPQVKPTRVASTERKTLSKDVAATTRELRDSPASFTDYIAISPYRRDGVMVGYRISPGKKPKLFKSAGFKAGDVVYEINGLDLTDPQQSMEAMNALRQAQSLQLSINRGEESVTLYLDIPSAGLNI